MRVCGDGGGGRAQGGGGRRGGGAHGGGGGGGERACVCQCYLVYSVSLWVLCITGVEMGHYFLITLYLKFIFLH